MKSRRVVLALAAAAVVAGGGRPGLAEDRRDYEFVGLTYTTHDLVFFSSDAPGTFSARVHLSGAVVGDALAVRPSMHVLYGLRSLSGLTTIDPSTGVATDVGDGKAQALDFPAGTYGVHTAMDFEPGTEMLRVMWPNGLTYRIDPDTGKIVDGDGAKDGVQPDHARLRFVAGDARAVDELPLPLGLAFDRSDAAGPAYMVHGRNMDALARIDDFGTPADDAIFATVGNMPIGGGTGDCSDLLEIASDGAAFLITQRINRLGAYLARVDLRNATFSPSEEWPSRPDSGTDIIRDENLRAFCISPFAPDYPPLPQDPPAGPPSPPPGDDDPPPPDRDPPPPEDTPPDVDDVDVDLGGDGDGDVAIGGTLEGDGEAREGTGVAVSAGSARHEFVLDRRGRARDGGSYVRFRKARHGRSRFRAAIDGRELAADLAAAGEDGTCTLRILLDVGERRHAVEVTLRVERRANGRIRARLAR